jgi:hypothetical protein
MSNEKRHIQRTAVIVGCVMLSVVAMLLWGRLKLVAGVPRTALAEPEAPAAAAEGPANGASRR